MNEENIRIEYGVVSEYFRDLVKIRFTIFGAFVAASGFIVTSQEGLLKYAIFLIITIAVWLIEIRNRMLIDGATRRLVEIERKYWGYSGEKSYEPFFAANHRHIKPDGTVQIEEDKVPENKASFWFLGIWFPASTKIGYSMALDVLFCFCMLYSIIGIVLIFLKN